MFRNFLEIMIRENVLKSVPTYHLLIKQLTYVLPTVHQDILLTNQHSSVQKHALKENSEIISLTIALILAHLIQNTLEIQFLENVYCIVQMDSSQMLTTIENVKNIVQVLDLHTHKIQQEFAFRVQHGREIKYKNKIASDQKGKIFPRMDGTGSNTGRLLIYRTLLWPDNWP